MLGITVAVLMSAVAFGGKNSPSPLGPVPNCWNKAVIKSFANVAGVGCWSACPVGTTCRSYNSNIDIFCDNALGKSECYYCIKIQYSKWNSVTMVYDDDGFDEIADFHASCKTTPNITDSKLRCETTPQKRKAILNVFDEPCLEITGTSVPVATTTIITIF